MHVQDRIAAIAGAIRQVKAHPMCLRFDETETHYLVTYPDGDFPVRGCRASKNLGGARALLRMLDVMERHWIESYPTFPENASC